MYIGRLEVGQNGKHGPVRRQEIPWRERPVWLGPTQSEPEDVTPVVALAGGLVLTSLLWLVRQSSGTQANIERFTIHANLRIMCISQQSQTCVASCCQEPPAIFSLPWPSLALQL